MQATVAHHPGTSSPPSIRVTIVAGTDEICIRISDQGTHIHSLLVSQSASLSRLCARRWRTAHAANQKPTGPLLFLFHPKCYQNRRTTTRNAEESERSARRRQCYYQRTGQSVATAAAAYIHYCSRFIGKSERPGVGSGCSTSSEIGHWVTYV